MIDTALFGKLAGGLSIAAYFPFILAILRGKAIPNRASWIIWTFMSGSIFFSYVAAGAMDTAWVPAGYTIGSFVISLFSIKYGEGGWTKLDRNCFLAAAIGLLLWWISGSPLFALFISLSVDIIASLPTIKKSYKDPHSEDKLTWFLFWGGSLANVLAIDGWTFEIYSYPIAMFVLITLIAGLVIFDQKRPYIKPIRIVK